MFCFLQKSYSFIKQLCGRLQILEKYRLLTQNTDLIRTPFDQNVYYRPRCYNKDPGGSTGLVTAEKTKLGLQCCQQGPYLRTWVCNTDLLIKRGPY